MLLSGNISDMYLGFDYYPKKEIVAFIVSTTGDQKSVWEKKSDAIYYSYHSAVKTRGFPVWHPNDPAGSDRTVDHVTQETGLPRNDVYRYLLSLYTMANMGKIETQYWSPKVAGGLEQYGAQQLANKITGAISPVLSPISAPTKGIIAAVLITGAITAIGIAASKQAIKTRSKRS